MLGRETRRVRKKLCAHVGIQLGIRGGKKERVRFAKCLERAGLVP